MKVKYNGKKREVTVSVHIAAFRQMAVEQHGLLEAQIAKGKNVTLKDLVDEYPWAFGVVAVANALIPAINEDPTCNYELNT